jgi:uncharacterized protein (TIGR02246 family)
MAGFLVASINPNVGGQDTPKKPAAKSGTQAAVKATEKPATGQPNSTAAGQAIAPAAKSADEIAVRQTGDTFVTAFNRADAKATSEHYTTDAEYIDDTGRLLQGRSAIEESLKSFFEANPDSKLVLNIESIRFVEPSVAIEDGTTTVTGSKDLPAHVSRYVVVHVKSSGNKWLVASVRETAVKPLRQHKTKLRQLDWMLGEWVHEGTDAVVVFKCEPIENGSFLLRNFTIKIAGVEAMSGSQRIGWDAQAGKFRAWIFDSDGGHSDGYWHRDGDSWVLKASGITADGQPASSTSIYSFVNQHTMTFQSVDHEVAGVELPDGPKVTIVRHPPRPE